MITDIIPEDVPEFPGEYVLRGNRAFPNRYGFGYSSIDTSYQVRWIKKVLSDKHWKDGKDNYEILYCGVWREIKVVGFAD